MWIGSLFWTEAPSKSKCLELSLCGFGKPSQMQRKSAFLDLDSLTLNSTFIATTSCIALYSLHAWFCPHNNLEMEILIWLSSLQKSLVIFLKSHSAEVNSKSSSHRGNTLTFRIIGKLHIHSHLVQHPSLRTQLSLVSLEYAHGFRRATVQLCYDDQQRDKENSIYVYLLFYKELTPGVNLSFQKKVTLFLHRSNHFVNV